jgi:hypothetical protein
MIEKLYHIYVKDSCIYHSLKEEEFNTTWIALNRLGELLSDCPDLSYEEVTIDREIALNSSH